MDWVLVAMGLGSLISGLFLFGEGHFFLVPILLGWPDVTNPAESCPPPTRQPPARRPRRQRNRLGMLAGEAVELRQHF